MSEHDALVRTARLIAGVRDVIDGRATSATPPAWCVARGHAPFLAALSDDEVWRAERDGLQAVVRGRPDAPADLRDLSEEVDRVCSLEAPPTPAIVAPTRGASERKRAQVARMVALLGDARDYERVVDVGAGHGHLTRELARLSGRPTVGWEREPSRVAAARARTGSDGPTFVEGEVEALARELRAGDLVVGLHACGALGEVAIEAAGRAGAAVLWVGCCLQKRDGARAPMTDIGGLDRRALVLSRDVLGLANVRRGDGGVEEDLATRALSRQHRLALRLLLARAGVQASPGAEMHGLNRRSATGDFSELARRAFAARGLAPPTEEDVAEAARDGAWTHALARRWELPRTMLGRALEVWVARDRAGHLAALGYRTQVRRAFDDDESPRDVAIVATPPSP